MIEIEVHFRNCRRAVSGAIVCLDPVMGIQLPCRAQSWHAVITEAVVMLHAEGWCQRHAPAHRPEIRHIERRILDAVPFFFLSFAEARPRVRRHAVIPAVRHAVLVKGHRVLSGKRPLRVLRLVVIAGRVQRVQHGIHEWRKDARKIRTVIARLRILRKAAVGNAAFVFISVRLSCIREERVRLMTVDAAPVILLERQVQPAHLHAAVSKARQHRFVEVIHAEAHLVLVPVLEIIDRIEPDFLSSAIARHIPAVRYDAAFIRPLVPVGKRAHLCRAVMEGGIPAAEFPSRIAEVLAPLRLPRVEAEHRFFLVRLLRDDIDDAAHAV